MRCECLEDTYVNFGIKQLYQVARALESIVDGGSGGPCHLSLRRTCFLSDKAYIIPQVAIVTRDKKYQPSNSKYV